MIGLRATASHPCNALVCSLVQSPFAPRGKCGGSLSAAPLLTGGVSGLGDPVAERVLYEDGGRATERVPSDGNSVRVGQSDSGPAVAAAGRGMGEGDRVRAHVDVPDLTEDKRVVGCEELIADGGVVGAVERSVDVNRERR